MVIQASQSLKAAVPGQIVYLNIYAGIAGETVTVVIANVSLGAFTMPDETIYIFRFTVPTLNPGSYIISVAGTLSGTKNFSFLIAGTSTDIIPTATFFSYHVPKYSRDSQGRTNTSVIVIKNVSGAAGRFTVRNSASFQSPNEFTKVLQPQEQWEVIFSPTKSYSNKSGFTIFSLDGNSTYVGSQTVIFPITTANSPIDPPEYWNYNYSGPSPPPGDGGGTGSTDLGLLALLLLVAAAVGGAAGARARSNRKSKSRGRR